MILNSGDEVTQRDESDSWHYPLTCDRKCL